MQETKLTPQQVEAVKKIDEVKKNALSLSRSFGNSLKNIREEFYKERKNYVTICETSNGRKFMDSRLSESGKPVVLTEDKDGVLEFEGKTCTRAYNYGGKELRFTTQETDKDGNPIFKNYFLDKNTQKYVSKECDYLLGASVIAMSITQFKHNDFAEITRTMEELEKSPNEFFTKEELKQDALAILNKANKENGIPVFHLCSHGHIGLNQMTLEDTRYLNSILDAIKETNYDKPIMIEMMHCGSGVTIEEMEILKSFPVGSMLLTSQDSRKSPAYLKVSQSPIRRKDSSLPESFVYVFDQTIDNPRNNMTCAIVTNNEEVKLFSEDGNYSIEREHESAIKSEILPDAISKEILDELVLDKNLLGNSIFALKCLSVSLDSTYHR